MILTPPQGPLMCGWLRKPWGHEVSLSPLNTTSRVVILTEGLGVFRPGHAQWPRGLAWGRTLLADRTPALPLL